MQQVLGGLPHCRLGGLYGAGGQITAPEATAPPIPVGQGRRCHRIVALCVLEGAEVVGGECKRYPSSNNKSPSTVGVAGFAVSDL